ncbi:hypothetical protein DL768_000945 [Monosporascus sp. mg162]|nr:hypothetical protein DL768_000945 [Monosporascus sp. mg162]
MVAQDTSTASWLITTLNTALPAKERPKFLIISNANGEDIQQASSLRADAAIHCGDVAQLSRIREFRGSLELSDEPEQH